jgi:hypothetical protein
MGLKLAFCEGQFRVGRRRRRVASTKSAVGGEAVGIGQEPDIPATWPERRFVANSGSRPSGPDRASVAGQGAENPVNMGAWIARQGWCVTIPMAEVALPRHLFADTG